MLCPIPASRPIGGAASKRIVTRGMLQSSATSRNFRTRIRVYMNYRSSNGKFALRVRFDMRLNINRLLLISCMCFVSVGELSACTCAQRSACASVAKSSDIFLGTAVSEEFQSDGSFITHFDVMESFQGKAKSKVDLISLPPGQCGTTRFRIGTEYLVFSGRTSEGQMAVGPCNPSLPVELAAADLRYLRRLVKGEKSKTWLYGLVARLPSSEQESKQGFVPLAGTMVKITGSSGVAKVLAGADGTFETEDLPPGSYKVEPHLPDTLVARSLQVQLGSVGCADALLVTFWNGRISGEAIAPNGQPVSHTDVTLLAVGQPRGDGIAHRTDEEGRFKFEGLAPGRYQVGLMDFDGLPSEDHPFPPLFYPDAPEPETAAVITLQPGQKFDQADFKIHSFGPRTIRVEALWPDKRPAVHAEIHVEYEQSYCWKQGCPQNSYYETDQNGRASFYAYGEGKIRIYATTNSNSKEIWISDFKELDLRALPFSVSVVMSSPDHYDRP
jgi:hypothetical protein